MDKMEELSWQDKLYRILNGVYIDTKIETEKFITTNFILKSEVREKTGLLKNKYALDKWFDKDELSDILTELKQHLLGE